MTPQELIGGAIFISIALAISITLVLGFGVMLHVGKGVRREPIPLIFLLFAAVIVAAPIASGRNLSGVAVLFEANVETFTASLWINRIVNLLVLALAVERVSRWMLAFPRERVVGWPFLMAFLLFVLTNGVLNGIWGTVPALSHQILYTVAATMAVALIAKSEIARIVWHAKTAIVGVLLLSLIFAVANPAVVIQQGYTGGFLPIRFWGLGAHANTLSPLIVCLMFCLWYQPYEHKKGNVVVWVIAIGCLLLTQSKTAIAAAGVVLLVLLFYKHRASLSFNAASTSKDKALSVVLGIVLVGVMAILGIQIFLDLGTILEKLFATKFGSQITTVSNRDQIWSYALREWRANIWFGYGTLIFNDAYRSMIGIALAFHAHNQFMQSLSSAGLVGVLGLIVLVITMGIYAWRARVSSAGVSVAMFAFIVLRGIAEVPLPLRGVSNSEFFFFAVFFAICLAHQPTRAARSVIPSCQSLSRPNAVQFRRQEV